MADTGRARSSERLAITSSYFYVGATSTKRARQGKTAALKKMVSRSEILATLVLASCLAGCSDGKVVRGGLAAAGVREPHWLFLAVCDVQYTVCVYLFCSGSGCAGAGCNL